MAITLAQVAPLAILLVVLAIVLSVGQDILGNIKAGQTTDSYAYNATAEGEKGLDKLASWQDTIGLVVAAAVVIGIVVTALSFGKF